MAKYWLKLYHDLTDDMKTGRLSHAAFRVFILALCLAGEEDNDGILPETEIIEWRMRRFNTDELRSHLQELASAGLLELTPTNAGERWQVSNFAKRQAPVPASERMKYYRKRERDEHKDVIVPDSFRDLLK